MDQRGESGRRDLPRNLGNPDRSAKLISRLSAHKDAANVGKRPVDHEPRFLRPHDDGAQRSGLFRLNVTGRHRPADTEHAQTMDIAKIVFDLLELGCRLESDRRSTTVHLNRQRFASADADDALHVGETLDFLAIDRGYQIAGLKSGRLRRAGRLHRVDQCTRGLLADRHENGSKNGDRQHEVRDRPGSDDRRARAHRLKHEAVIAIGIRHRRRSSLIRYACRIVVAEELHITAERNCGNFPARPVAIIEAGDFGAKSDREYEHLDAAQAGHQEMTKLVKENDDRQYEQKWDDVTNQTTSECTQTSHKFNPCSMPSALI